MVAGGFQTQVYSQPAPAVEGDFASQNPYYSFDAGPGGLVAGAAGLIIGRFAWAVPPDDPNGTPAVANNFGFGPVAGFVHRVLDASIVTYLDISGMTILPGRNVTLHTSGDYWVRNSGSAQALPGQKCYANFADGKATFAATASPAAAGAGTGSIAASTFSVTGSISGDKLTVTAVGSGVVRPGATITGTGIATGTKVTGQLTGTTGGVGTYSVNIPEQTVASTTVSGTYGTLTITVLASGTFGVGSVIAGTGVTSGTRITQLLTGAGGTGTYAVDPTQTAGSTADITSVSNVETKWIAMSSGLANELVKISAIPLG